MSDVPNGISQPAPAPALPDIDPAEPTTPHTDAPHTANPEPATPDASANPDAAGSTALVINQSATVKARREGQPATPLTRGDGGTIDARRPRTNEEDETVSINQKARAIASDPGFWKAAATIPLKAATGRPGHNPRWLMLLVSTLATQTGTQRSAIAYLADPVQWAHYRDYLNSHRPPELPEAPVKPPARHHLSHFLRIWKSDKWQPHREAAARAAADHALQVAHDMGHFNPDQPLKYNEVDPAQWLTIDGTVYGSPSKRRKDDGGRYDPASAWHAKGGAPGGLAYGSKFSLCETVTDQYNEQLVLSFQHVTTGEGEAAASLNLCLDLKQRAPGIRGVTSDTAFRGTHNRTLTQAGVLVVSYPAAATNPNRATGGRLAEGRTERNHKIRTHTHTANGRQCRHVLRMEGSVPVQETYDAVGDVTLQALDPVGYVHRHNRDGSHTYYLKCRVACRRGDTETLIRLDDHADGDLQGWSRAELARFYPVGTTQFDYLAGRRNSSESLHSKMKRTMPRLPAYGAAAQELFILGYQIANNAIAAAQYARRRGQPNALDGTL